MITQEDQEYTHIEIILPSLQRHLVPLLGSENPDEPRLPDIDGYTSSSNARRALWEAYNSQSWVPYVFPESEAGQPRWNDFNAAIGGNARLNEVWAAAQTNAPVVTAGVPAALTQVASHGAASFAAPFEALCQFGGATQEDREAWAALAEQCNLPPDFIAVVKGESGLPAEEA